MEFWKTIVSFSFVVWGMGFRKDGRWKMVILSEQVLEDIGDDIRKIVFVMFHKFVCSLKRDHSNSTTTHFTPTSNKPKGFKMFSNTGCQVYCLKCVQASSKRVIKKQSPTKTVSVLPGRGGVKKEEIQK